MTEYIYKLYNEELPNFNGFIGITNSLNDCKMKHFKIANDPNHPKYNEELYVKIRNTNDIIDNWKIEILEQLVKKSNKRKKN